MFFVYPHLTRQFQKDSNALGAQYIASSKRRDFASTRVHIPLQIPLT